MRLEQLRHYRKGRLEIIKRHVIGWRPRPMPRRVVIIPEAQGIGIGASRREPPRFSPVAKSIPTRSSIAGGGRNPNLLGPIVHIGVNVWNANLSSGVMCACHFMQPAVRAAPASEQLDWHYSHDRKLWRTCESA